MEQNKGRQSPATDEKGGLSLQPRGYEVPCSVHVSYVPTHCFYILRESNKSGESNLAGRVHRQPPLSRLPVP